MSMLDWTFNPLTEMERMRREMDNLFGRLGYGAGAGFAPGRDAGFPEVNLYDGGDDLLVAVEAPGVPKDKLRVELRDNALILSGVRQAPDYKDASVLREETPSGSFTKSIRLPVKVHGDKVEAQYRNGILHIRLPKSEESKPKQIAITA